MRRNIKSRTIRIPHLLNYMVRVRVRSRFPSYMDAGFESGEFSSTIYLRPDAKAPVVAHEISHVLRHICQTFHMASENEDEHMAYLTQYLMATICGYEWD